LIQCPVAAGTQKNPCYLPQKNPVVVGEQCWRIISRDRQAAIKQSIRSRHFVFSKKSLTMPTKEEYSILLTCGLGARKWQVSLDFDEEAFQSAIYKIYPRLTSVSSYTLWNIKKDKTFEKLPAKVNTPSRIRAYLGNQFSGCLLIMPSEEIQLVSTIWDLQKCYGNIPALCV